MSNHQEIGENIGLVSATNTEFNILNGLLVNGGLNNLEEGRLEDLRWMTGSFEGKRIILVRSGVGKANAAASTQYLIDNFHPDIVIDLGLAGLLDQALPQTSVIVANSAQEWDAGIQKPVENNTDYDTGKVIERAKKLDKRVVSGTIITGDTFITDPEQRNELQIKHNAVAVDMESAAVAKICHRNSVPFLIIKAFSDSADKNAQASLDRNFNHAVKASFSVLKKLIHRKIV